MLFLLLFIFLVGFGIKKLFESYLKSDEGIEYINSIFRDRDLPMVEEIKLNENFTVRLYGMKYEKEDSKEYDTSNECFEYHKLVNIINKHLDIEIKAESGIITEVNTPMEDLRNSEEFKHDFIEIMNLVSNFNLAQFVFKGEETFKLFNIGSEVIEKIKDHADVIIDCMIPEVIRCQSICVKEEAMRNGDENGIAYAELLMEIYKGFIENREI